MKRIVGWKVLFFLVFKRVYSHGVTPLELDAPLVEKTRFSVSKKVWAREKEFIFEPYTYSKCLSISLAHGKYIRH